MFPTKITCPFGWLEPAAASTIAALRNCQWPILARRLLGQAISQREKRMKLQRPFVGTLMLLSISGATALHAADMPGPVQANEIKWGPAPPVLPAGAKAAVLAGDPASSGFIAIRLKMPAGYKIPAHWHPTDEHITVISGTFAIGMGDKIDEKQSKTLKPGGYAVAQANMHHFAWTKTGAVVEVNMVGPFKITYVNPADDPSQKK
jgi:quercetin dioxygenase-like cupin family protein